MYKDGRADITQISMSWLEFTQEDKLLSIIREDTDRTIRMTLEVFEDLFFEGCEFRVPERPSCLSCLWSAVWVLRLFLANLCIDLINMNYCLCRYKFPDANLYCYYSTTLSRLLIETEDLCRTTSALHFTTELGNFIPQEFDLIIQSLDLVASSTFEHPSRRAPDVFNQFTDDLKATAVQMRQFMQTVYLVARKSTDSEFAGPGFVEMNAGGMQIGDMRVEPVGNAYAQFISSEKHLLEVQRANEFQSHDPSEYELEPPPPYCSSGDVSPHEVQNE